MSTSINQGHGETDNGAIEHEAFEPHEIEMLKTLLRRLCYLESSTRIADRHSRKEIKALRWAISLLGGLLPPAPAGLEVEVYTRGAAGAESRAQ